MSFVNDINIISSILKLLNINFLKELRYVNSEYKFTVDKYLFFYFNDRKHTNNKKLTLSDLETVPIIAFYQLYKINYDNPSDTIIFLEKRKCISLCKWLCDDNYINAQVAMNSAVENANLQLAQYLYQKKKILPNYKTVNNLLLKSCSTEENSLIDELNNKLLTISWCISLNIYPLINTVDQICDNGDLNLLLFLEKHNILPSLVGVNMALNKNKTEIVKYLYSKNIIPHTEIGITFHEHGNLELTSWLWDRNTKINHTGLFNFLRYGHLNILKFIYDKNISFKEELIEYYSDPINQDEDDEDEQEINRKNLEWLNSQQGIVLIIPEYLDNICFLLYNKSSSNIIEIQQKHIEILNWCEEYLNILPTENAFENAATSNALEVLKWLISRNIKSSGQYYLSNVALRGNLNILKFLYEECNIIPEMDLITRTIAKGYTDIVDYIMNIHCNIYLNKLNIELISNKILNKKINIDLDYILQLIFLDPCIKIMRKEKKINIIILTKIIKKYWYELHFPHLNHINRAIANDHINVIEWGFKNNIVFNYTSANAALKDKHLDLLKLLYLRDILPVINAQEFSNIIRYNDLQTLKWLIDNDIFVLTKRQTFIRDDILYGIDNAARDGHLDILKFLYTLTIIDRDGNRLNTLPNIERLEYVIYSKKIDVINWFLDKVFMMLEIEKNIEGKLSVNNQVLKKYFINIRIIKVLMSQGCLSILKRYSKIKMFDEETQKEITILNFIEIGPFAYKINLIKWLDKKGIVPSVENLNRIASYGCINLVKYYANELDGDYKRTKEIILPTSDSINQICILGQYDMLKWILDREMFPDEETVIGVLTDENINILNLLYSYNIVPNMSIVHEDDMEFFSDNIKSWLRSKKLIE